MRKSRGKKIVATKVVKGKKKAQKPKKYKGKGVSSRGINLFPDDPEMGIVKCDKLRFGPNE